MVKLFLANHKPHPVTTAEAVPLRPIARFRAAVLEVIRINRRKRIQMGEIQKYSIVLEIQQYELKLRSNDKEMLLTSLSQAHFFHSLDYAPDDPYHSQPFPHFVLIMPNIRLYLNHSSQTEYLILQAGMI